MLSSAENTATKLQQRLLFILPALYVLCGVYFRWLMGGYYTVAIDPEYSYLFNGANVAQFSWKVWHVDHPGTPLQMISGATIWLVHLFLGKGTIASDVVRNPELYLGAINFVLFSLNGTALYYLGRVTQRAAGKTPPALFLQLTPFLSFTLLTIMLRVSVEQTLILAALLLMIWLIKFLYDENTASRKYVLAFALIIGFAVSSKIIAAPLFFIPFIILPGWRRKLQFTVATFIAFVFYILPVLIYRFDYFAGWISNLLFHSGQYGSGTEEIVDKKVYVSNLKDIFSQDIKYTGAVVLGLLVMICYLIPGVRRKINNRKLYWMIFGVTLASLLNAFMIAKHYAYYYLVTSLCLNVFLLFLLYQLLNIKLSRRWLAWTLFLLVTCVLCYSTVSDFIPFNKGRLAVKEERAKTDDYISGLPSDKKMLVIAEYYGSAFKEGAVTFGLFWGGDYYHDKYQKGAIDAYPNTFLYSAYDKNFHDWKAGSFSIHELLKENKQLLLYSNSPDLTFTVPGLQGAIRDASVREIYTNTALHESIYLLERASGDSLKSTVFKCDAEILTDDAKYFKGTGGIQFLNDNNQTTEKARSGQHSAKFIKPHEFGMTCTVGPFHAGDRLYITAWRHVSNKEGAIILQAHDSKKLYLGSETAVATDGEWEKLMIEYTVTPELQNEELVIYAWGHSGRPVYFDDLEIEKVSP